MYHSLNIGNKNTWDDYSLIPESKIYIPIASQKTKSVEIEGGSGSLDFSTLITGYPIYSQLTGTINFRLMNRLDLLATTGFEYAYPANYNFYDIFAKIYAELDGFTGKVWLEDDPEWCYDGRINVQCSMAEPCSQVSIGYDFKPYKYARVPKTWTLNGLGSIINRQIISAEDAGFAPQHAKFVLLGPTGTTATVRFVNEKLGIDSTKSLTVNTSGISYEEYEWVIYGESSLYLTAASGVSMIINHTPGRL